MEVQEVILPEDISEITLGQFLKLQELEKQDFDYFTKLKRKVSIFTGIPYNKLNKARQIDFERINNLIDVALSTDVEFTPTFEMHGIKYGFIPNLDKITFEEYILLTKYGVSEETLPNTMAILFRPIVKEEGSNYEIMPYRGTVEFVETIKDMPLNVVNGALVFFCNLANELQTATQKYLSEELRKESKQPRISLISGGIQRLKNWLTMKYLKLNTSKS